MTWLQTSEEWNSMIDEWKDDVEWEPLKEFLERLKEPVEQPAKSEVGK